MKSFWNDDRGILFDYVAGLVVLVFTIIVYFVFYPLLITTLPALATNVSNDNALIDFDIAQTSPVRIAGFGFRIFPWIVVVGLLAYYLIRSQLTEFDTGGFDRL